MVNPTVTTTYYVRYEDPAPCSTTSTCKTATVTVNNPNNNVTLAATTDSGVTLVPVCTTGPWTYYANSTNLNNWLFGINKNGNTFTANVILAIKTNLYDSFEDAARHKGVWAMSRNWNVTLANGSVNSSNPVSVRFFYNPADTLIMKAKANARAAAYGLTNQGFPAVSHVVEWFKTTGGVTYTSGLLNYSDVNNRLNPNPTTITGTLNSVSYVEYQGLTGFSGGTGAIRVSPLGYALPVQFMYINAEPIDNRFIRVNWATASEIDNRGFDVERSTDGIHFTSIGWVDGHGNSTSTNTYHYDDMTALPNAIYYYRLKQIDIDGRFDYTEIVSAVLIGDKGFVLEDLRPNPAANQVYVNAVSSNTQNTTISVTNMLGQIVISQDWQLEQGLNGATIELSNLDAGTYTVAVKSATGTFAKRLVVAR